MGAVAFSCLRTPFYTTMLSPTHPPPLLLPRAMSLLSQESCSKKLDLGD